MNATANTAQYAGDIAPSEAWRILERDPAARLVDVRTAAEWNFVGLPDLTSLRQDLVCVEWQKSPGGRNADFVAKGEQALAATGAGKDSPVLFLCRSGGRSRAAAIAMTAAGYSKAFNIAGGFEGDLDGERHRGSANGWKAEGLPWRQT